MKKPIFMLLALIVFVSGCEMKTALFSPSYPLVDEGELFVYLQPFPAQAERLKFKIEELWALRSDGTKEELHLALTDLSGAVMTRQRLFAAAHLAPGSYRGFVVKAGKAVLRREEGEANLLLPEEPVVIEFPFTVTRRKALLVAMSLPYSDVVIGGFRFSPSFVPSIPERPLLGLTGYVTNRDSHTITVFDKRAGQAAAVIETDRGPAAICLDAVARRAYVALSGEDAVDVIDMLSGEIIHRIQLSTSDKPQDVVLVPGGRTLLTANTGSDTVSFVDPISLKEDDRVRVGNGPNSIVIDPSGKRAFVFNTVSSSISVIDLQKRTVLVNVGTEPGPLRGQFNRKGDRLYVYYENSPYLVIFDPVSFSVLRRLLVGPGVSSLKVDITNDFFYLGRKNDSSVEVYDPFSLLPGDIFNVGGGAGYMTIDGELNNLLAVLPAERRLAIVNKISRKIVSEVDVGEGATRVVVMGEK